MPRKITRIFINSLAYLFVTLVLISFIVLLAIQSYTFQTWLGNKASVYLSKELQTKVEVKQIKINFFTSLHLNSVTILDRQHDTLFLGNIDLFIKTFNIKEHLLHLKETRLSKATVKLIRQINPPEFNYDFLRAYFAKPDSNQKSAGSWHFDAGELDLQHVNFSYQDKRHTNYDPKHINYHDIRVSNLQGHFKNLSLFGDSIQTEVEHLSFIEKSGFVLNELSGIVSFNSKHLEVKHLQLHTPLSKVRGKIQFNYDAWEDYQEFVTQVNLNCELKDSSCVDSRDVAYFTEELDGLNQQLCISGKVNGTVSDLRLSELVFSFGAYTKYKGYASIQGLPDIASSFIHLDAKQLSTHYSDLTSVPTYPFKAGKKLPLPEQVKMLGLINFRGKFDGFVTDFTTYGKFKTAIGNADTRLSMKLGEQPTDIEYHGKLSTENFDLGKLFGVSGLHSLSLNGDLDGNGSDLRSLAAGFNFKIQNLSYNNYNYKHISLRGHIENKIFNGMLVSLDTNVNFDFNGSVDFNKPVPDLQFISTINRVDLSALKFLTNQDSGIVSAQVLIDTRGSSIDNLSGLIHLDNLIYTVRGKKYKLSSFNLELDQVNTFKKIDLSSAYLNASLHGRYKLSNVFGVFKGFLYNYYPTFFQKPQNNISYNDSLSIELNIKNFSTVHELFFPNYMLSRGSRIQIAFDAGRNKFDMQGELPVFSYQDFNFYTTTFQVNELGKNLKANISTQGITFKDSNLVNQLNTTITSNDKNINYSLVWNNQDTVPNYGKISGGMSFNSASFDMFCDTIEIKNAYNNWNLKSPNTLSWLKDGSLLVQPLVLNNKDQEINISGKYTNSSSDSLVVNSQNVDLSSFNPILHLFALKFNGTLNGHMVFSNANQQFVFRGNVDVQNFKLNDNSLGKVILKTDYTASGNFIRLEGYSSLGLGEFLGGAMKDITFNGNYYLDGRKETVDIDFKANTANLRLLNPLLEGLLTVKNGFVRGEGKVHGDPQHIMIDSHLNLFQSEIKVDYTNVTYYVTGEIDIMPDQIRFTDLLLRDKNMRSPVRGTLNGNIFHDNFENIRLDYDLNFKNMLTLNTTEELNPYYYGQVYGSGNLGLYGYLNNLNMEITTSVEKNSKFYLPLDGPAELNDENYITFVVKDTLKKVQENVLTGFNLDMNLKISPDAELSILMDRKTGDVLNVKGEGNLDLNINTLGKFDMTGDYIITDGEYLFTLKTLINKKFEIESGSSITWSGDPMNAEIDVITRYRQRASVAPLLNDTTGMYGSRQPVDCKLIISGKLATPNINFDIDVPNLEPTAMARIDNVLSDEAELNRQVFSFLLFRSFTVPQIYTSQGGGVSAGSAAASTGSEMLSNRASEFLNSYFGNLTGITDMQVGVNYRPGTTSTGEEFDVALSKQFMNNRITVDGNFGVNSNPNNSSSGLIGDVVAEYKLSEDGKYRVKVFNQTNDNTQVTILGGPYTQGIGLFYREEFNTFRELLSYYRKKLGKEKQQVK